MVSARRVRRREFIDGDKVSETVSASLWDRITGPLDGIHERLSKSVAKVASDEMVDADIYLSYGGKVYLGMFGGQCPTKFTVASLVRDVIKEGDEDLVAEVLAEFEKATRRLSVAVRKKGRTVDNAKA